MASEAALGITIPNGARIVRNIIESAQYLHSHILWFYTLAALDYIDPSKALEADIANTYALAEQAGTTTSDFGGVKTKLANLIAGGQISIFSNGWFKHPAYSQTMPAELALIGVAHYLEALEMQAEASRIIAIMGGKFPHFMTSLPGGTAWVPTEEKLGDVLFRLQRVADFVHNTMVPDVLAIAPFYTDALKYGGGHGNFLAWGVFNRESLQPKDRYLPEGVLHAGSFTPSEADRTKVKEFVKHGYFASSDGNLNPSQGETHPEWPSDGYNVNNKYTWAKAPRYDGAPMEAGPLSRMLIAYVKGVDPVVKIIDSALAKLGATGHPEVLVSLLGRVASKTLEAAVVADWGLEWVNELIAAIKGGDVKLFEESSATEGEGAGTWEAPRGAVGHWMTVKGGRIENYQVCTPSTWNMGGRDDNDTPGVLEKALIGSPCLDPTKPMEAARIARSFDP
jgi:hydrogenase large subunit